jgi:cyclic beta-1,2-glucan synthetase
VELLNPLERTKTPEGVERYAVEPYVMAADVYGMPPFVGRGGWTWYTGAAAWVWRLTVEGILGLTRRDGALHVDPCIPPTWPGFEAWVRAGELTVHVRVHNDGPGRHVREATLDGVTIPEARVGLTGAGARRLEVWLGRPGRPRPIDERGGVEAREGSGRAP